MNGQISEHPLGELINEIGDKNISGALRLSLQRVKAVVYFDSGQVIYAMTNVRQHRFIEYLQRTRILSTEVAESISSKSDFEIASELLRAGVLEENVLIRLRSEQTADILRMLLLWIDGHWSFDSRARLTEPIRVSLPIDQLLLDATRRLDPSFIASRWQNDLELISLRTQTDGLSLSPTEGFLLSRIDQPLSVSELVSISGLPEAAAQRVIYGLVLGGQLSREFPVRAFTTSSQQAATPEPPKQVVQPTTAPPTIEPSEPAKNPRDELTEFLDELDRATSHYEVLNVSRRASNREVKDAYHSLARRYHPDRFHEFSGTELHARLESGFARITQSYELLADPNQRASYDHKIESSRAVSSSSKSSQSDYDEAESDENSLEFAEKRFQEGLNALKIGQISSAVSCFSSAARIVPSHHAYRAHYGLALASDRKTRRLAEAELMAAIKLAPSNAAYRVMLAGLYRSLGFPKRAVGELERALALDPTNDEARRMLRTLELNKA